MSIKEKLKAIADFLNGTENVRDEYEQKLTAQAENHRKEKLELQKENTELSNEINELYKLIPKKEAAK